MNNIQTKMKSKKLNNKSIKLFMIVRNIKKISYELDLFKKMQIYLVFYAFMFQHCNQNISLQISEMSVELNKEYEIVRCHDRVSQKNFVFIKLTCKFSTV